MNPNVVLMTLVVALEPIPILGGVLLLTAKRGRPKAVGLLLGWVIALALVGVAVVVLGGEVSTSSGSSSSKVSAVLDVVLGLALAGYALRKRAGARSGSAQATPKWMTRLDTMSPVAAFALGAFLPPYLIAAAVANDIVRQHVDTKSRVIAMTLYVVIGSTGILVPILLTVVRPHSSEAVLLAWRHSLQANWRVLMYWLFLAVGVYVAGKGVLELWH